MPLFPHIPIKAIGLGLLALAASVSSQSIAESVSGYSVKGVMERMAEIQNKMQDLETEAQENLAENENEQKQANLWHEQLEVRMPMLFEEHETRREAQRQSGAQLNAEVERHNTECAGEVAQPKYDKCVNQHDVLTSAVARHDAEVQALDDEHYGLTREWDKYVALIDAANSLMTQNVERHYEIMDHMVEMNAELEYLHSVLQHLCAEAEYAIASGDATDAALENLHHCHSMFWDGANGSLPPLDDILTGTPFFQ